MVKDDFQLAVFILNIAEAVFHLHFFAFGGREEVIAHGHRAVGIDDCGFILPAHLGVGRNGEAAIFLDLRGDLL